MGTDLMNSAIPVCTEEEQKQVSTRWIKRYGKRIPTQLVNSELQLDADPGHP